MKRIVIGLCLLPLILLLVAGCEKKPPEEQIFNEAKKFQEEAKYAEAVASYEKLVQMHPRGKFAPQSQFMVGFIEANELKDLTKAEAAYKAFLEKYSTKADSGMVASAQWELKNLGKDINQIQDLAPIIQKDSSAIADTTMK
jgi:outer membrane protein assembly factor BamD (BamD/ComL family)